MGTQARSSNKLEMIGVAAADKANDSHELLVYAVEMLPLYSGELKALEISNPIQTSDGVNAYASNVTTTNCVNCIYGGSGNTNRAFPPDVRKGEYVKIYSFSDTDTWYWETMGRNDNQRRTETLRFHVSGTPEFNPVLNDDNTYFIELDTRRSNHIVLSTSQANGETYRYLIKMDSDKHRIYIGDSDTNYILLESDIPKITMYNKSKSLLTLNDKNIDISCKGNFTMNAGGTCTICSGGDMKLKTGGSLTETTSGSNTRNIGGSVTETTGGSITRVAGGAWSVSFGSGGMCKSSGSGASMTMQVAKLSIKRA